MFMITECTYQRTAGGSNKSKENSSTCNVQSKDYMRYDKGSRISYYGGIERQRKLERS